MDYLFCRTDYVGEVRHPEGIRPIRRELTVYKIQRPMCLVIRDRGADTLTTHDPSQSHGCQQALYRAFRGGEAFSLQLKPDLARPVHSKVFIKDPPNVS
jgi:hypothetical protein